MEKWFTPQERGVILFLVATIILGVVVYIYKSKTPYFAPELKILANETWTELQDYKTEDSLADLIQKTEAKLMNRKSKDYHENGVKERGSVSKLNINTATGEELISLSGIGPVLAKRIIEYRERKGGFKIIEDIINVRGIGQKKFETLKDKITI